jgi:transposase
MAHSSNFREKAIAFKEEGHTFSEMAKVFGISSSTYYRWVKIKKATGKYKPQKTKASRQRKVSREKLEALLEEKPDLYLHEIAEELGCTKQAVHSAFKRYKITRKKKLLLIRRNQKKREGNTRGG